MWKKYFFNAAMELMIIPWVDRWTETSNLFFQHFNGN